MKKSLPKLVFTCTKPQLEIFNSKARFKLIVAGRRFGKTFLSKYVLVNEALKGPQKLIWYIAPTYRQAKELMWVPLKDFIPKAYIRSKNETELSITLINGSIIKLKGADYPDSLRGNGLDYVVCDEMAFQAAYVWEVIRPALADKQGGMMGITTPAGYTWFYDFLMKHKDEEGWQYFHYTSIEGGNIPASEIEASRRDMDPRKFRQEMEASFENVSGRVYFAFDPILNVRDDIADDGASIIHIGMDFNVSPLACAVGVKVGPELHIIDEILIEDGNTELVCKEIKRRYPGRTVYVYPDPTGARRQTSAVGGVTDHSILRSHGFQVLAPAAPWPESTKINTVNQGFCNGREERKLFLKRGKTTEIQKGLLGFCYVAGTNVPDPRSNLAHVLDALGYMCLYQMSMNEPLTRIQVLG